MPLLLLLTALAVLAAIAVVAAGRGGSMGPSRPDRAPYGELPADRVDRSDIGALRFSLAFRGYRIDEVDAVLDRLGGELELRDRRIAELEGQDEPIGAARDASTDAASDAPTDAPRET